MRILHTSDWHIGRRFKGVDLVEYQRRALDWLVDTVRREHVDVVCVSGDVYDSPMPSAASVDLLDDVLTRLTSIVNDEGRPAVDVIVTPGNHDSARKLGFGARMMRPNLHLRCETAQLANPVIVTRGGADGREDRLAVYALPYLDPDVARPVLEKLLDQNAEDFGQLLDFHAMPQDGTHFGKEAEPVERTDGEPLRNLGDNRNSQDASEHVRHADSADHADHGDNHSNFGDTPETTDTVTPRPRIPRSHEGVMTAAMRLIRPDLQRRRHQAEVEGATFHAVLMAHAFVSGAAPSDSERNITIGGVDSVPAAVFSDSGLDYLALGHLHRAQQVRIPSDLAVVPDRSDDEGRDLTNMGDQMAPIAAYTAGSDLSESSDLVDLDGSATFGKSVELNAKSGDSAEPVEPRDSDESAVFREPNDPDVPVALRKSTEAAKSPRFSKFLIPKGVHSTPPYARYAGSLLAYSFSEACTPPVVGNGKSVVIIDMPEPSEPVPSDSTTSAPVSSVPSDTSAQKIPSSPLTSPAQKARSSQLTLRTIPVESGQPALVRLTGSPEELLGDLAESHRHDWASLTVVSDTYPHGMYQKLDAAYEHALEKNFKITQRSTGTDDSANGTGADRAMANLHETRSELDVLTGFVRYALGRDPNDGEIAVLRDAVERVHATDEKDAVSDAATASTASDTTTPANRKGARA